MFTTTKAGPEESIAERLSGLNTQQREAVECVKGSLLCLAGAGSGKTRVLTTRIANLILNHDVSPQSILALTFTRKAAGEMRQRLSRQVGAEEADRVTLGTFHAIGAQILREYGSLLSLTVKFGILDESDSSAHVREVLKELGIQRNDPVYRPGEVADQIAEAKRLLATRLAEEARERTDPLALYRDGDIDWFRRMAEQDLVGIEDPEMFVRIYSAYQIRIQADDMVDFQDLIGLPLLLLHSRREVRHLYQRRWTHISVDEYQDTSRDQDALLGILSAFAESLCVVGDDDQAIYGFRGASVESIRAFEEKHQPCTVIRLEENYRSTPEILTVANAVISAQEERPYTKTLRPNLPSGDRVRVWSTVSGESEAESILDEIDRLRASGSISALAEVMILYRINALAGVLERALRNRKIPYTLTGNARFHERKEVRDIVDYLRLVSNPADTLAFSRIVNVPRRGIGPATMEAVLQDARSQGVSPLDVCANPHAIPKLRKDQKAALSEFSRMIESIQTVDRREGVARALRAVVQATGYQASLLETLGDAEAHEDEEAIDQTSRGIAILAELEAYVEEFDRGFRLLRRGPARTTDFIEAFMSSVAAESTIDEPLGTDGVRLMSIHASKGLESPVVFVIGLEERVLPLVDEPGPDMEEEGRLFYVAVTRAQRKLILSSARTRALRGSLPTPAKRSRFLNRLPETGHVIESR